MDETKIQREEPRTPEQPSAMHHNGLTWLLTWIAFVLELHQFRKRSFLATLAVLDLGLIIYFHWPPRKVDQYTAIANKVPLRILTFVLCIAVSLQILSYCPLSACSVGIPLLGILILLVLISHPGGTLVDNTSETGPNAITVDPWAGYVSSPPRHGRDLEKGGRTSPQESPQHSFGFSTLSLPNSPKPQYHYDTKPNRSQPTSPYIVGYMRNIFGKRCGRTQPCPMKETHFTQTFNPVAKKLENPHVVGDLKASVRTLLDSVHALQSKNQALQSETAEKIVASREEYQKMVNQGVERVFADSHVIPKNDLRASVAFVGNFCCENGLDLFRADGSPVPDLQQFGQGLGPPQGTQGSVYERSSVPGYGASSGHISYPSWIPGGASASTNGYLATPTPVPTNANGGYGGFSILGAAGASGTSYTGSGAAPIQPPQNLAITFRHQDPLIADTRIPFPRHQTLNTCQDVYRNAKDIQHTCKFHYLGSELNMRERLDQFRAFQAVDDVIIDVSPEPTPAPGDLVVKFKRTDNPAATPVGIQMVLSRSSTLGAQEKEIEANSNVPFVFPDNVTFHYNGIVLRKDIPLSSIAIMKKKKSMVTIMVSCSDPLNR